MTKEQFQNIVLSKYTYKIIIQGMAVGVHYNHVAEQKYFDRLQQDLSRDG